MKKLLTNEEIKKLLEMEPNTCWSRAHEILNSERSKNNIPLLNRSWFFEGFLKRHGAKDGKMRGFKYTFKPEVKKTSVEEVKPNLDNISVEDVKQEVKENPVSESVAELLSPAAMVVLKLLYHNRFDKPCMKELLNKFPQYSVPHVKKAWDELKENGYFTKSSPESKRFLPMDWQRAKRDLPELMVPLKDGEDSCILKKVTTKVEPEIKVEKPMPYKSILKESLYSFLDNLNVPYGIRELSAAFPDLDPENIQMLQDRMLDEGILIETPSGYCPSYDWQTPIRSSLKEQSSQILLQKKDFVVKSSKIRIVNESGREIKITITDTEVILKV